MDVMVDIETLSSRLDAVVLSIGACEFDPESGVVGLTFYGAANPNQSGRHISGDTVLWWLLQDDAARKAITGRKRVTLEKLLEQFSGWFPGGEKIWSHATFDIPVLTSAYESVGKKPPWIFSNCRDIRTILDHGGMSRDEYVRLKESGGTLHDALSDAIGQAAIVSACIARIRGADSGRNGRH